MTTETASSAERLDDDAIGPDSPIMFVGDTHGDLGFWGYLLHMADEFEVEQIIQLGDFGFWPHVGRGMNYLRELNKHLDVPLWWIDGNHDNHDYIAALPRRADGLVDIADRVTHVPRGARFQLAGTSFLAIGGAYSIDKDWRRDRMRQDAYYRGRVDPKDAIWWAGEMVTEADVQRCLDGGEVDVVIAHDTPLSVAIESHFAIAGGYFVKADLDTQINRGRLERVLQGVRPKWWINGHYHLGYRETLLEDGEVFCRVVGLGANVGHFDLAHDPKAAWWIATPRELLER